MTFVKKCALSVCPSGGAWAGVASGASHAGAGADELFRPNSAVLFHGDSIAFG